MKIYRKPEAKAITIDLTSMLCNSGTSGGGSSSITPSPGGGVTVNPGVTGGGGNASEEACSKDAGWWE